MPTYAYRCRECDATFDKRMSISAYSAGEPVACPTCSSEHTERTFTSVNVLTGSRSGGGSAPACAPSGFG